MRIKAVVFLFCCSFLYSQTIESDTLSLVEISWEYERYSVGHYKKKISLQQTIGIPSLSNALEQSLAIPFKNYGFGMLSTIAFRGLAAAHTGLFWEGLPLNSSMNGNYDYNLLQSSESIIFRSGGGSSVFGSGAIGGSIHLLKDFSNEQGWSFKHNQMVGSFGTYLQNTRLYFTGENQRWVAGGGFFSSNNDYTYIGFDGSENRVQNAQLFQQQFFLDAEQKIGKHSLLDIHGFWLKAERHLPASMTEAVSYRKQEDENQRFSIAWKWKKHFFQQKVQAAYFMEKFDYKEDFRLMESSFSKADNYFLKYDAEFEPNDAFSLQTSHIYNHTNAMGDNFGNPTQNQSFHRLSGYFKPTSNWEFSGTIQHLFHSDFNGATTFDFGVKWSNNSHSISSNFTNNYRVPTINDQFWRPGGNPDLLPEKGWMHELNYEFKQNLQKFSVQSRLTTFYGEVNDWILWLPTSFGFFSPINIQQVQTLGLQSEIEVTYKANENMLFHIRGNYNFTETTNMQTRQSLAYIPKHQANVSLGSDWNKWKLNILYQFVGFRYTTTDETLFIPSYQLTHLQLHHSSKLDKMELAYGVMVQNIFNEAYFGMQYYPMPLRYFMFNLNIIL